MNKTYKSVISLLVSILAYLVGYFTEQGMLYIPSVICFLIFLDTLND